MDSFTIHIDGLAALEKIHMNMDKIRRTVQSASGTLAVLVQSRAPVYRGRRRRGVVPGALRNAITPSPWAENSASPYKVVHEVYFDYRYNDLLVKYSANGTRYYYPASQEYGFLIHPRAPGGGRSDVHVPGKFFMKDSTVTYVPYFRDEIEKTAQEAIE